MTPSTRTAQLAQNLEAILRIDYFCSVIWKLREAYYMIP